MPHPQAQAKALLVERNIRKIAQIIFFIRSIFLELISFQNLQKSFRTIQNHLRK